MPSYCVAFVTCLLGGKLFGAFDVEMQLLWDEASSVDDLRQEATGAEIPANHSSFY